MGKGSFVFSPRYCQGRANAVGKHRGVYQTLLMAKLIATSSRWSSGGRPEFEKAVYEYAVIQDLDASDDSVWPCVSTTSLRWIRKLIGRRSSMVSSLLNDKPRSSMPKPHEFL